MKSIYKKHKRLGRRVWSAAINLGRDAECPITNAESERRAREIRRPKSVTIKAASAAIFEIATAIRPTVSRRQYLNRIRPTFSLQEKLDLYVSRPVWRAVSNCLRQYERGEVTEVERVADFSDADISLEKNHGWIDYSRKPRWGIVSARYHAKVLAGWTRLPAWLRSCDGMLTLAAVPVTDGAQEGEEIWRAKWARQGAEGPVVETGFIIRHEIDGRVYTAHGKTVASARGVITRQLPAWISAQTEKERERAARIERIKAKILAKLETGQVNGYGAIEVTVRDSIAAGNCESGTSHWIARHFPGQESATVEEIVGIEDQHERVLLACCHAIRKVSPELAS